MTAPKKDAPKGALRVTRGNIVFDKNGVRRFGGDEIDLTAEQAKAHKDAGRVE